MVDVQPRETKALAWSWLYFFCVLSAYYVIRPLRDEIGAAGGVAKLPWLFAGTLIGMAVGESAVFRACFAAGAGALYLADLPVFRGQLAPLPGPSGQDDGEPERLGGADLLRVGRHFQPVRGRGVLGLPGRCLRQ